MTRSPSNPSRPVGTHSIEAVRHNRERIAPYLVTTPLVPLRGPAIDAALDPGTEVLLKLDTLQPTGSFKVRGVMTFLLSLDDATLSRGVVTMSAGNHAAAVAYGAQCLGTTAKVVMPRTANPRKQALPAHYGADIVFVDDIMGAQQAIDRIVAAERRTFVPAWGTTVLTLGTASIALELLDQHPDFDAFVVAIGGGSICAGAGALLKQCRPRCEVLAVEPEGAATMNRSFASGRVERLTRIETIADGLAPPESCAVFLPILRECVDELTTVSDRQIVEAMRILFADGKLAIEPSGAAALAGALGPFRKRLAGRRVVVMVSGSNIDADSLLVLLEG